MKDTGRGRVVAAVSLVFVVMLGAGCSPAHFDTRTYTADDGSSTTQFRSYDPAFIEGVDAATQDFQMTGAHHLERSEERRVCCFGVEKRVREDETVRYYVVVFYTGEKVTEFGALSMNVEERNIYLPREKEINIKPKLQSDKTVEQELYYRINAQDLRLLVKAATVPFELEVKVRDEPVRGYLTSRTIKGMEQFVDEHVDGNA